MTWPTAQAKTNFDAAGDDPKQARSEFAGNVDKFNQLQAHVSSYIQGLLDDADAAAARTTLDTIAVNTPITDSGSHFTGTEVEAALQELGAKTSLVFKTANETVNNSTTLQDDDHLSFAMAANTTYSIRLQLLLLSADATPDFKFGWTVPTGCTMEWEFTGSSSWVGQSNGLRSESQTVSTSISTVSNIGVIIWGFVLNGANAGNLQLQWSQRVADVSDSKLLKNSFMAITKLGAT